MLYLHNISGALEARHGRGRLRRSIVLRDNPEIQRTEPAHPGLRELDHPGDPSGGPQGRYHNILQQGVYSAFEGFRIFNDRWTPEETSLAPDLNTRSSLAATGVCHNVWKEYAGLTLSLNVTIFSTYTHPPHQGAVRAPA